MIQPGLLTVLLILLPLVASVTLSLIKGEQVKKFALAFSLVELAIGLYAWANFNPSDARSQFLFDTEWVHSLGIRFTIGVDGISMLLVLLTVVLVPLIILSSFRNEFKKPNALYALILFMQAGLIGVFTSLDAFLFYVSWEAALIPIYFICATVGDVV